MKYLTNNRGVLPILVAVLVVVLLAAGGVAIYNVSKSNKKLPQTVVTSPSPRTSPATSVSPVASATPGPTDQQLILSALLAQCVAGQGDHLGSGIAPEIQGDLAKANVTCVGATGGTSGYQAILQKSSGKWAIIYSGQEPAGSAIGVKYGLPASWYDPSHQ